MRDDHKQLVDLVSGNLSPLALWRLQRRLTRDPELRRELAELMALTEQLHQATTAEPSPDLDARLLTMRPFLETPQPVSPKVASWWGYRAPITAVSTLTLLIFLAGRNKTSRYGTNIPEGGPQNMEDLLKWQWVVFLVPLSLAVLLALATAMGVGGDHAGGDGELDHELETDSGHDAADHESEAGDHFSALGWLGVGQAPLSMLLICLLIYWAAIGCLGNLFLGTAAIGYSVALALVGSLTATAGTARLIKRFLPTHQSFFVARHELIGREGVAIYPITEKSGTVRLYDKLGTLRQLDSRVLPGEAEIPQDTKVVVVDYNREHKVFTVQKWDDLVRTKEEEA